MMKHQIKLLILILCLGIISAPSHAQIKLGGLKNKGKKLLKKVTGEEEETTPQETGSSDSGSNSGGTVQGKKLTPPDVNQQLDDATAYYAEGNYGDARYSVQQAMMGVELELGYEVLELLPTSLHGLDYKETEDQVYSTGFNFVGLTIARAYEAKNQRLEIGVMNNSTMMAAYTSLLTNANYASSNGEAKSIRVQGEKAVIKFDGDNEYELGVPLGQETIFIMTCENFADEVEVLAAVNEIDLSTIKNKLGEQ